MKYPRGTVLILSVLTLFLTIIVVGRYLISGSIKSRSQVDSNAKPFHSYVTHGSRLENKIALTFDADMTPFMEEEIKIGKVKSFYNQTIVDILEKEKIPTTIFMAGMWAETYPEIAKKMANDPLFEIANHSYSHPGFTKSCFGLPKLPVWGDIGEYQKSQAAIKKAIGVSPKYFRFPGGCQKDSDIKAANDQGLTVVGWDVAGGDGFNLNTVSIINKVVKNTQNGSIIVLHFGGAKNAPKTADALPQILNNLRQKGFEFVKLSELTLEP